MSSCGVRVTWVTSTKVLGVAAGGGGPMFSSSASFLVGHGVHGAECDFGICVLLPDRGYVAGCARLRTNARSQGSGHGARILVRSGVGLDLAAQDEVGAWVSGLGGGEVLAQLRDSGGGLLCW